MRAAFTTLLAITLALPALGQAPHFTVVSLRAWGAHDRLPPGLVGGVQQQPGRVLGQCVGLSSLVFFAYGLTPSVPVEGMPKWAGTACSENGASNAYLLQATSPPRPRPPMRGAASPRIGRRGRCRSWRSSSPKAA